MIHFLRNEKNRTIIECSVYNDDLSAATVITEYSEMLLNVEDKKSFIEDISALDEIRGWWWEKEMDFGDWKNIDDFVGSKFKEVARQWNLNYVTD